MTVLGFTGTRHAPTLAQAEWMARQIEKAGVLHHGACVGADAVAHELALVHRVPIVVHPPFERKYLYTDAVAPPDEPYRGADVTVLKPKGYASRNRDIVLACDEMIAVPNALSEILRSGTWMTIRFAHGQRVPVTVCLPTGEVHSADELLGRTREKEE